MHPIESVKGSYCKIECKQINLNSASQVKDFLLSEGWVPTQYNINKETREPTSPKLTEDSFGSIKSDAGKLVAKRNVLIHRRRSIENFDDPENKGILSSIRADGRVGASGMHCATPTGRTTHRVIVNVPKADPKVIYGYEMRKLFCVLPPYVMIGADLEQIEARVTAHFASIYDGGAYWDVLTSVPDVHQYNADMVGITRNQAKSFMYAVFFGARAPKVAQICDCSIEQAQVYLDNFWNGNPGVGTLVKELSKEYKKNKFIVGIDGRKLMVRAEYKALNTIIQGTAALIFKRWLLLAYSRLRDARLDCKPIIAMHDESQYRCMGGQQEEAIDIIMNAATDAGKFYNLFTEVKASCSWGMNWAETH